MSQTPPPPQPPLQPPSARLKNAREINQDWERPNLFEVRNRDKLIEYLKKREHESRVRVQEETARKRLLDIERRLEEFDRDINLRRVLRSDRRYLSIGRDRPSRFSKFFDPVTMARISRDVAKIRAHTTTLNNKQPKQQLSVEDKPSLYGRGENAVCSKFWYEENVRRRGSWESGEAGGITNGGGGASSLVRATKLPELVGFKKSENSDCVNQHLDMQHFVPNNEEKNRYERYKRNDYSVINTRISIIRPKY